VSGVDAEKREFEVVFSTGAGVPRRDVQTGEQFLEKLSLQPTDVDLTRVGAGACPLLDSHTAETVTQQIGTVVRASVNGVRGIATIRLSRRSTLDGLWLDIQDRIIAAVSIGYSVAQYVQERAKESGLPVRTATRWTLYEISMVALPADADARVRAAEGAFSRRWATDLARQAVVGTWAAITDEDRTRWLEAAKARVREDADEDLFSFERVH
jgi:HK97 family phage prohead protease